MGILLFLGLVLLTLANVAFWAYFTLLNTQGWVATVGPVSQDPAVAKLVGQYVVGQLFEAADVQGLTKETLPPELQILAGPITVGLEQLADEAATRLIMTDAFNSVWVAFNRTGHRIVMDVLKGRGDSLYFQEGDLVLDFSEVYSFLEDQLGVEDVNLIPQAEGGRLVLMSSYHVAVLQEVVSYLNTVGLLLPLLTIVALGAAVWVSPARRQTVVWIGLVIAVAMFVSLIAFAAARSSALISIQDPFVRELGRALINALTHGLMVQTFFFLVLGLLLIVGGWQAAPDSALMRWEAARKEREAARAVLERPGREPLDEAGRMGHTSPGTT
ncbi:MAG: hypothetical protein V2I26_00305 [Halieaceae bacterium]|nr:hypothetical protein [Halieaceae bacterium]